LLHLVMLDFFAARLLDFGFLNCGFILLLHDRLVFFTDQFHVFPIRGVLILATLSTERAQVLANLFALVRIFELAKDSPVKSSFRVIFLDVGISAGLHEQLDRLKIAMIHC